MATVDNTAGIAFRSGQLLESRLATYTAAASQNDVVLMVPMYRNEVVMAVNIDFAALGANSSVEVGDSVSATHFIGSTVTTSAGTAGIATNRGYKYTADDNIKVTFNGSGGATGAIIVKVDFVRTF